MKFLELTPAQTGCTGFLAILTGLTVWIAAATWGIHWLIHHVRFV